MDANTTPWYRRCGRYRRRGGAWKKAIAGNCLSNPQSERIVYSLRAHFCIFVQFYSCAIQSAKTRLTPFLLCDSKRWFYNTKRTRKKAIHSWPSHQLKPGTFFSLVSWPHLPLLPTVRFAGQYKPHILSESMNKVACWTGFKGSKSRLTGPLDCHPFSIFLMVLHLLRTLLPDLLPAWNPGRVWWRFGFPFRRNVMNLLTYTLHDILWSSQLIILAGEFQRCSKYLREHVHYHINIESGPWLDGLCEDERHAPDPFLASGDDLPEIIVTNCTVFS